MFDIIEVKLEKTIVLDIIVGHCVVDKNRCYVVPPFQNNCLNFVLSLVQSCTKAKTFILERMEYFLTHFLLYFL